jgi:hypothetical protein
VLAHRCNSGGKGTGDCKRLTIILGPACSQVRLCSQ